MMLITVRVIYKYKHKNKRLDLYCEVSNPTTLSNCALQAQWKKLQMRIILKISTAKTKIQQFTNTVETTEQKDTNIRGI